MTLNYYDRQRSLFARRIYRSKVRGNIKSIELLTYASPCHTALQRMEKKKKK